MKKNRRTLSMVALGVMFFGSCLHAADKNPSNTALFESPDAKAIVAKDKLLPAMQHAMPQGCVTNDAKSIELGKILFNDYGNKNHKFKQFPDKKDFGNCVACHNIEGANGYGNIGPDLSAYNDNFILTGIRTHEWIYQKIADARVDNPLTGMTINKTNALLNEQEICHIMSYMLSKK